MPSACSRRAARLAPASSSPKVRRSSPSVAPTRRGLTAASRVRRSWMRTSIAGGVSAGHRAWSSRRPSPRGQVKVTAIVARVVDEASLLADVDRLLHTVVTSFGEPVAAVLEPLAASGSRHRARMVLQLARHGDRVLAGRGAAAVELLHLGTR